MKKRIALFLVLTLLFSANVFGADTTFKITDNRQQAVMHENKPQKVEKSTTWNIKEIYASETAFQADFVKAQEIIEQIAKMEGKLNTIKNIVDYYKAVDNYIKIVNQLTVYADMQTSKDQSSSAAKELKGRVSRLDYLAMRKISFALPEILSNSQGFLDSLVASPEMKPYLNWFSRERDQQEHQLSENGAQLLMPTYRLQDGAYLLYNTFITSEILFPYVMADDETETVGNTEDQITSTQYDQKATLEYYEAVMQGYRQYRGTLAQNYQNYCVATAEIAALQGYSSSLEAELSVAGTPMSVYNGILKASGQSQASLEKYFNLLKKALGVEKLYQVDLGVLLADDLEKEYTYEQGKKLVKAALSPLGNDYGEKLGEMLQDGRIDVYPQAGKESVSYAVNIPNLHPYILLNYYDDFDSVSTLAHELGHGVHMLYSKNQSSSYNANPTNLTSEVASTLNQILLSDYMIKTAKTDEERRYYCAQEMKMLIENYYFQSFFARYQEMTVSAVEKGGTLTADALDEMWVTAAKETFGDTLILSENFCGEWARVPHFYQGFYVYQYAVGFAAACDIVDGIQKGEPNAVNHYLDFLKAGDSADAVTLLKIAGVDISNGSYTKALSDRFERLMSEFEKSE